MSEPYVNDQGIPLDGKPCKIEGCPHPAPTRGRYAGYCPDHRAAKEHIHRLDQATDPEERGRIILESVLDQEHPDPQLEPERPALLETAREVLAAPPDETGEFTAAGEAVLAAAIELDNARAAFRAARHQWRAALQAAAQTGRRTA